MDLFQSIEKYIPVNEQEERDRELILRYMRQMPDCLERTNQILHFTTSVWTVNEARTKTLMVYHNIYNGWSWIGGHADGEEDLRAVAMRELREETGVRGAVLASEDMISLEILAVNSHMRRGAFVPAHLHLNVTYLAEADEREALTVNREENQAVKWWTFEEALKVSNEPWYVENIYKKLIRKSGL